MFFLSGFAGLVYESLWSQQLSIIFGSTELAIAAVLASYMGGLALGAKVISLYIHKITKPVKAYAIIELLVAISALSVPYLLDVISHLHGIFYLSDGLKSGTPSNAFFYVISSFVVLLIPTSLMGATLPLISKYIVNKKDNLGNKIGFLYAINTLGAGAGALTSAFVLLPLFGLGITLYVAVLVNLLIFFIGILYLKVKTNSSKPEIKQTIQTKLIFKNQWIFPIMFVSGSVSLAYEILWTRLLSHILGGSVYSFGVMLFVFLLAIAIGAFLGSLLCKINKSIKVFIWVQIAIALCFSVSFYIADLLPSISLNHDYGSFSFVYESLFIGLLTLFPGALFIGATFPLAIDIVALNNQHSGVITARVYSWNTVGAIFGSIIMGFYLLTSYGFAVSTQVLASISLLISITVIVISNRKPILIFSVTVLLCLVWIFPQSNPNELLKFSVLGNKTQMGKINYLGIGESATVILLNQGGEMRLLSNGLPESAIQIAGSREGKFYLAHWLSMLPVLAYPDAKSMLVVGLGAGLTLKAVPQSIDTIDVIELEQQVINANKSLSQWRGDDPLLSTRVKIHNNDARNALRNSTQNFDIIVSQPSHPWTAGAASLYTREFFEIVKNSLNNKGVFIQWIGMRFIDAELLKSLLATLNTEFKYVELYQPLSSGGLVFVSSNNPIILDKAYFGREANKKQWYALGINNIQQVQLSKRLNAQSSRMLSNNSQICTDYYNVLKLRSPKIIKSSLNKRQLNLLFKNHDPLIDSINQNTFVILRRLVKEGAYLRLQLLTEAIINPTTKKVVLLLLNDIMHKNSQSQSQLIKLLNELQYKNNFQSEFNEILFHLIKQNINQLHSTLNAPILQSIINKNEFAINLIEAWRMLKLKKWNKLDQYIKGFAKYNSDTHPANELIDNLKMQWLMNSENLDDLQMLINVIDHKLAIKKNTRLLFQKIKIAIKANQLNIAIASIYELISQIPKTSKTFSKTVILKLINEISNKIALTQSITKSSTKSSTKSTIISLQNKVKQLKKYYD